MINDPVTVEELAKCSEEYEQALVQNDVETLKRLFWVSSSVMRFGVTENLYGTLEIDAFRQARPAAGLAREVVRLDVVTFGTTFGSVTLEFARGAVKGRQSQVWVKLPEGWRIVAAHVSLLPTPKPEESK